MNTQKTLSKLLAIILALVFSCSKSKKDQQIKFYLGSDLSYVNEMEDCGASYKNNKGEVTDVFKIFKDEGANLVRVRKWHSPEWTKYSNYEDIEKTIQRAKNKNLHVLLDFHYSDDWADPQKQIIPKAWLPVIDNIQVLGDSLYNYTYKTLQNLLAKDLLPEMVQVGNETNIMILQKDEKGTPMNWSRNSQLLNKGIKAVRDFSKKHNKNIEIMLHIAQPENGLWWFKQAKEIGITDFDWIGLSYYPKWSKYNLEEATEVFKTLINTYNKKLMVVETAYPFSLQNQDKAGNILGRDALIPGYEATQEGQFKYLEDLKKVIKKAGGQGLVYWEPAWVTNTCSTRWGQGSHWENATLFDFNSKPTLGLSFLNSNK
ncbi:MAG: glycosyl hydrolase 53 family protein [Flavobacteriaceae bacterium]|nr:glycosyl hydrolase 53 family protein [Flavobacteriaceae bacterium]